MDRTEVKELHFITRLSNLPSIMQHGIVSFERAKALPQAESIANSAVQERRERVQVPGGLRLHHYANLYLNARNAMMYDRQGLHASLGIVRVRHAVLDLDEVVVSDQNASKDYVRFGSVEEMLPQLDAAMVYTEDWRHPDPWEKLRRKAAAMAEVLVPGAVHPSYVRGVYVSCDTGEATCRALGLDLKVKQNAHLFFRG